MKQTPHDSAHTHVRGSSEFVEDIAPRANELHLSLVCSTEAHANILKVEPKDALKSPGVSGVFTAKDITHNLWGSIFKDQPLLADDVTNYYGEPIAIVAAATPMQAKLAATKVKVQYQRLKPILSISVAIKEKSFIGDSRTISRGDFSAAYQEAPLKLEGSITLRGADHFYLENQCSVVYPLEDDQLEIHSSTQHPTETQHLVAHALGLPDKNVVCITKRMGGAFGGKESQAAPFAAYAAIVAKKLNCPARIALSKDDDMQITGKRNPFENKYRVGFNKDGKLLCLEVDLFSDGGAYADLSTSIMERAMLHCDNSYFIPVMKITGQVCRTNFHPHTAFRGFGGPKGVATIEKIIEEIAHQLGCDALDIRKLNCYQGEHNITHYGQTIQNNCLPKLFSDLEESSNYRKRRSEIHSANKSNPRWRRGLSLTSVKFGISFTTRFLNQANALVLMHRDGSLQVSTGATEMGQGVNRRIAELIATELGLSAHQVKMMPTRTDKNANTSPTAASSGTDLNGAAALLACRRIKYRLSELASKLFAIPTNRWPSKTAGLGCEPEILVGEMPPTLDPNEFADGKTGQANFFDVYFSEGKIFSGKHPHQKIALADLVNEAYLSRISLSEYGFYRYPNLTFDKLKGQGNAFRYFTQGTAVSEVSVDTLTGEVKVLRVDILMDLGRPIHHALDVGQITGGFVQGMGWVTTEKLFYSENGKLLSHAPSTYKIPNIQDTPRDFRVNLLENEDNSATVRGTKAVGEPPLLLSLSVWTAIHDALKKLPPFEETFPQLEVPATNEQILRALEPEKFKRWDLL